MTKDLLLITGATSGLGKDCAIYFNKNYSLVCIGRDKSKILKLKKKLNNNKNKYFICDFTKKRTFNYILSKLKKIKNISKIIHCAGGGLGLKDPNLKKNDYMKLLDTNFFSVTEINRVVLPNMKKTKKKSVIIMISSVASIENVASVGYTISKNLINIYAKMMSKIYVSKNIFFKNLLLGAFEGSNNSFSRLKKKDKKAYLNFKKKRLPRNKFAKTKEIISVIEFLTSEKSEILAGSQLLLDFSESSAFKI